jgi:serine phosphatase RsbU (regulator of sigma subunit)
MCAPLLDGDGNPFGVVQIDTGQPLHAFTIEDLEVMVGAVSQAAVAVRFAKLHEEALRRQAVARDLELARRVQLGLLPEGYPDWEGFEFFAYYHAAHEVGGDYYDFIALPNDRLALVVADAAGKGVSAALMAAKLSGELKYYLSCQPPGPALAHMNNSLCAGGTGRFVTLLAAVLDRRSLAMTLVNAGHPAPLRRRPDGTVEAVAESARGPALGLAPGRQYPETRVSVEPGDLWLAYTDGFTEATNAGGEMFGAARLRQRLAAAPPVVRESGDRIVREVLGFLADQPQSDDMCLVGWGLLARAIERTVDSRAVSGEPTSLIR